MFFKRIATVFALATAILFSESSLRADPAWDAAHQLYFDGDGALWMLYNYCGGCKLNLTSIFSAPTASPANAVTHWSYYGLEDIFYADENQSIQLMHMVGLNWSLHNLTSEASAPSTISGTALTSLYKTYSVDCEYDEEYQPYNCVETIQSTVFYFDGDHHLQRLYDQCSGWCAQDMNDATGGPAAASGSALTTFAEGPWGSVRVFYFDGDQNLWMIYSNCASPSTWCAANMNDATGGGPVAEAGSGLATTWVGYPYYQMRLFYLNEDHRLMMMYNNCAAHPSTYWCVADMDTATSGAATAAAGSALSAYNFGGNRVFYVASNGEVWIVYDGCGASNTGWCGASLSDAANGADPAISGSALGSIHDVGAGGGSAAHVFYFNGDHELFMLHDHCSANPSTGWCSASITDATGAPSAISGSGLSTVRQ